MVLKKQLVDLKVSINGLPIKNNSNVGYFDNRNFGNVVNSVGMKTVGMRNDINLKVYLPMRGFAGSDAPPPARDSYADTVKEITRKPHIIGTDKSFY